MLIDYKFKNYKSYYRECNFSMVANSVKEHEDNLKACGKERLSKVKIIYGANASGKTSFIQSMNFVKLLSIISNNFVYGNKIPTNPYKFKDDYLLEPTEFNITFEKNNTKYNYYFSCNSDRIIDESLDIYYTAKPTNIFKRTNTNNYKFNSDARQLNEIKNKNPINKLFLLTASTWNYEKVNPVVDFLMNDIVVLFDAQQPTQYNMKYIMEHNDFDEYKKFCLDLLNNADFSINDIRVNKKKLRDFPENVINDIKKFMISDNLNIANKLDDFDVYNIQTIHKIINENKEKDYILELIEESMGTQQLFYLAPVLFYTFKEGKVLFIDEIDRSLHPKLVEYLIKKFLNKNINKKNAQLICNTHDTNLLNLELFRRDEICFAERDNKTGMSELYSLADFSPRKGENILKAYLLGRFGAVPFIKED